MSDKIFTVIAVILVVGVAIGYPIWCLRHARWLLKRWGLKNGYYLTRARLVPFGTILFIGNSTLWRVVMTDPDGEVRTASARCGTENVEVYWDDEKANYRRPAAR